MVFSKNPVFPYASLILLGVITELLVACAYHEIVATTATTDAEIFAELQETGYSYYQGGKLLAPAPQSPHGTFKLRMNAIAAKDLDANGELPAGKTFREGSVVVKEVYQNNIITVLAIMKKVSTDIKSNGGWIWAELGPSGETFYGTNNRGAGCIGCHSDTPNRNLVRTFDLH